MGNLIDKFCSMVGVDMGNSYEDEYYDDYRDEDMYDEPIANEEYMPSRRNSVRNSSRVSKFEDNPQMKLVIMSPEKYDDSTDVVNYLKERKPVVINLEKVDGATSRRIVDFVSGAVYALDANIQKVTNRIFLIAPYNVGVMNEIKNLGRDWN